MEIMADHVANPDCCENCEPQHNYPGENVSYYPAKRRGY